MLETEKRRQERRVLARQPVGEISLHVGETRYPVSGINNISDSGISIFLDQEIVVPLGVSIEYAHPSMKLEVYGNATWCAARENDGTPAQGGFILGVELLSPMLLVSLLRNE